METIKDTSGVATLFVIIIGFVMLMTGILFNLPLGSLPDAQADIATTSVTVLNTPPNWTVDAAEAVASASTSPTNAGDAVTWNATATDSNGEDYFFLVCKTSDAPTANADAPPTCGGGASNQWAVSATTTSGTQATASYTTLDSDAENNAWFGWICDFNTTTPRCNTTYKNGDAVGQATATPFAVNHRPTFTFFYDDSPTLPGATTTFTATSSDTDTFNPVGSDDTVQLFVCRLNDFTGSACGAGGTICSSTASSSDPSCEAFISIPTQDEATTSFGFIIDNHGFAASGGAQGTDSVHTIANATPSINVSDISLLDTDGVGNLTLTTPNGQTTGFTVQATVSDNNGCQNAAGGNEISSIEINVYRSSIGSASCRVAGDYNANNCYPEAVGTVMWDTSSTTQYAGTCTGFSDSSAVWATSFPLWFIADPTDAGSQFPSDNWLASVRAVDDNFATSSWIDGSTGNELTQFLAFAVSTSSIPYGSLEPGQNTGTLNATTTISAHGNVGLDENLDGSDMCTTFLSPNCAGGDSTNTIFVNNQQYATTTTSVPYGSGTSLSGTPTEFELNVPKSTSTTTPATKDTVWGIAVPSTITLAGNYTGTTTITAVVGESVDW